MKVFRAYEYMNAGDLAIEKHDIQGALNAYGAAEEMFPDNLEMKYWHAVSLAKVGLVDESLPIFKSIFQIDQNWWILTKRLPKIDLLKVNQKDLEKILSQVQRFDPGNHK